jgi:glycosyltransferase involved in cell wall biosynthesis
VGGSLDEGAGSVTKILLFANTAWYLHNYRLPLAKALQSAGTSVVMASPHDRYSDQLLQAGFNWQPLELSRNGVNPPSELRAIAACVRLYRREHPDLVHHFTVKPVVYGTWAARIAGVPAVMNSITGLGYTFVTRDWRGRILRPLVRGLYRSALRSRGNWAIFQNPDDRQRFIEMGIVAPLRTGLIAGSGVDLERFRPTPEPQGPPVVVLAARMLWDKGIGELVDAGRRLREAGTPIHVRLVGAPDPGNPASIPEEQLAAWRAAGLAEWLGHRDDMPAIYADCHIVALPTYYGEGLPRSLVEAGACGRPVVASDVPGCREVVQPSVNGWLIPPHDPKALAEALQRLCTDEAMRMSMGARGREVAERRFSDATIVDATLKLYRAMLAETAPAQAEG